MVLKTSKNLTQMIKYTIVNILMHSAAFIVHAMNYELQRLF